jgi:hypothetical protein
MGLRCEMASHSLLCLVVDKMFEYLRPASDGKDFAHHPRGGQCGFVILGSIAPHKYLVASIALPRAFFLQALEIKSGVVAAWFKIPVRIPCPHGKFVTYSGPERDLHGFDGAKEQGAKLCIEFIEARDGFKAGAWLELMGALSFLKNLEVERIAAKAIVVEPQQRFFG